MNSAWDSIPTVGRPNLGATAPVGNVPPNGSKTTSPAFDPASMILSLKASGFRAGSSLDSGIRYLTRGTYQVLPGTFWGMVGNRLAIVDRVSNGSRPGFNQNVVGIEGVFLLVLYAMQDRLIQRTEVVSRLNL